MSAKHPNQQILISSSQSAMRLPRKKITQLVIFVAKAEGLKVDLADIAVVSARQIAAMNRQYLGHRGSTDVISFDLTEAGAKGLSCQIIVCGDVAVTQALKLSCSRQRELMLYVVHGLLHVIGYDDTTAPDAAKMHARQEQLLEKFLTKKTTRS